MKTRAFLLAGVVGVGLNAGHAQAQSTSAFLFSIPPGETEISQTSIPANVSGQIVVAFHGDAASGCAAHGLCGYAGTIVVSPWPGASIEVLKFARNGRILYQAFLPLGFGSGQPSTFAEVNRSVGGRQVATCGDISTPGRLSTFTPRHGQLMLSLLQAGGSVLATRCAGPVDGDVAGAAPHAMVPLASLLKGHRTLSLSGQGTFAGGGLAGTVDSTVRMRLGKPSTEKATSAVTFPSGIKTKRMREVTETLTLVRGGGQLHASVSGTTDARVCALLDSCGLAGTITMTPSPHQAGGALTAVGPASRPLRDFLTALGLSRAGNRRGIGVAGDLSWSDAGPITSNLTQFGTCTDTEQLGSGSVGIGAGGGALSLAYSIFGFPRTRCPGPLLGGIPTFASGQVSRSDLSRRTFTVSLQAAKSVQDDGYTATLNGALSLTLRPSRHVTQQVFVEPLG